jgi:uroporphyrinogen decarboxylase
MDFGFWEETLPTWEAQGYPRGANPDIFFGMDPQWISAPINVGLLPGFHWEVLEDRETTRIVRDHEGVIKEESKGSASIPRFLSHSLTDRTSWEKEFVPRLDPTNPRRYPANWAEWVTVNGAPERDYPLGLPAGSLYGWIRDWMGVENVSTLVYDDRVLFAEMVETVTDCIIQTLSCALESGVSFEYASMWEDMCYRAGPLLSPKLFRQIVVPNYKRLTETLRKGGVDVVVLDCDGDISLLIPLWLEAGVNVMFPIEVGVWGADPVALRRQYGKELLMIGGVSKLVLAGSKEGITAEVERLAPLVEEGGYIPTPDHRVPPDVPYEHYRHYLREARRVWGRNLPNLRPMEA